jgi:hypothetical protein
MPEPTNERVIVKDNDIAERQLSFDNTSLEPSAVKDFDAKPTTQRELISWYMYSWAVSSRFSLSSFAVHSNYYSFVLLKILTKIHI